MSSIPIENVYYLLCYAWGHVQEVRQVPAGTQAFRTLPDLLGYVLGKVAAGLVARGLDRNYVPAEAVVAGVRGKLDIDLTVRRTLTPLARTWCRFDEFHHDILSNQIIKSTLRSLLRIGGLDRDVRDRVALSYAQFQDVSDRALSFDDFRRVQLHRNNRGYDFALRLCRIIHESVLVDQSTGNARFHDFREDDARMERLFEDFLLNFYKVEQSEDRVTSPHLDWSGKAGSDHDLEFLPIMRTDIVLAGPDRVLIINAKYYREALKGRFDAQRVNSSHLYQIFTYMENLRPKARLPVRGMLLYPVVRDRFDLKFSLKGNLIRVTSIDLDQAWHSIHDELLDLRKDWLAPFPAA